jgi:hypothetical protein
MYRGICEKAAENGVLSTAPQTRGPRRFKLRFSLLRQAWTGLSLRSACWFLAFFPPPPRLQLYALSQLKDDLFYVFSRALLKREEVRRT